MRVRRCNWMACGAVLMAAGVGSAADGDGLIRFEFPEAVELSVLADYVGQRLGLNIVYDADLAKQRLTLKFTSPVAKDELLGIFRMALQLRGMALIETGQAGILKIIGADDVLANLPEISTTQPAAPAAGRMNLTQVVRIEHADIGKLTGLVGKFLTPKVGKLIQVPDTDLILITDYTDHVLKAIEVIGLLDVPGPAAEMVILPVRHVTAKTLAEQVGKVLADQRAVAGERRGAAVAKLSVGPDGRSLLVIAQGQEMARIRELAAMFDVDAGVVERVYALRHLASKRAKGLLESLLKGSTSGSGDDTIRMLADEQSNALIVWADATTHERIDEYLARFDQPAAAAGPRQLRVYTLVNARADEVAGTLASLLNASGLGGVTDGVGSMSATDGERTDTAPAFGEGFRGASPAGPNVPVMAPMLDLPKPPAYRETHKDTAPDTATTPPRARRAASGQRGDEITITAEPNSNALIVVATPAGHAQIETLLAILDKRRPQVLVEVLLVTIDSSDSVSVGVELTDVSINGEALDYLVFTSFGLSGIDGATGERSLTASGGLNAALIRPEEVPIILKALASEADAKVVSQPRLLVSDNMSATLDSTAEQPFTSINASDTVATTSFAGYAQAGTRLQVQPRISEGDYIELDFAISLSSFSGEGSNGVPPPRSSSSLSTHVRVPDGYTVIVGGLTSETESDSFAKIPLVGDIPYLGHLFQNRTRSQARSTLYAFIRPMILRDARFDDLKYISAADLAKIDVDRHDWPVSEPEWMDTSE